MTPEALAEAHLGARVLGRTPLGGGSLSRVEALDLEDGRRVVLKHAAGAGREARMLTALRAAGCPAPEVLFAADGMLLMGWLDDAGPRAPIAWSEAGAVIARLHRTTGPDFGWGEDHAFGPAAIPNGGAADWPAFWAERRLLAWPGELPADIASRTEVLAARLADLLPAAPPPALLHGDLWSGNLLFGRAGFSGVIDPACAHGDAEADLAMLALFAAPPPAFFEAYGPLAPGWERRRPVYQLWPALVHLRLFGSGYRSMVERLLTEAGA